GRPTDVPRPEHPPFKSVSLPRSSSNESEAHHQRTGALPVAAPPGAAYRHRRADEVSGRRGGRKRALDRGNGYDRRLLRLQPSGGRATFHHRKAEAAYDSLVCEILGRV